MLRAAFGPMVAVIYTGGAVAHLARLLIRFDFTEMPFFPDWGVVLLGIPGATGLVRYADEIEYRGRWERPVHWLIVAHLSVSVGLHVWIIIAQTHDMLSVFSYEYSYFGLLYFAFFAWRSWTMKLSPSS